MAKVVSEAVVKRLPRYYRYIKQLEQKGKIKVSSLELASLMNITASQVRQDFCNFGEFGQQGYGYDIKKLKGEIVKILGLNKKYNMIIFGAGNIGSALAGYKGFINEGFNIGGIFEVEPTKDEIHGVKIYPTNYLFEYLKENTVDIAVIATQSKDAEQVAETIVKAGIKNIWNFAPIELDCGKNVIVENIFMSDSLYVLSYKMSHRK